MRKQYKVWVCITIILLFLSSCKGCQDKEYRRLATNVLDKLGEIDKGLSVGYSYKDFVQVVRDAKIAFKTLEEKKNEKSWSYPSYFSIEKAMLAYERSAEDWQTKIFEASDLISNIFSEDVTKQRGAVYKFGILKDYFNNRKDIFLRVSKENTNMLSEIEDETLTMSVVALNMAWALILCGDDIKSNIKP